MCGICGRINIDSAKSRIPKELIHRMCETIIHRGPDSEGIYLSTDQHSDNIPVGLGIRRLAIIDLQTGDQPIHNEDKSIWIVLNGEIYNFKSLREDLEKRGHTFYTQSDTEVIVHLYEDLGINCLKYLRGMFALSLWDNNKQKLFLARDRLGKKPLCYAHNNKYLIFASELKAILRNPEIKKDIDSEALDYYLAYYYIPAPLTIFKQIRKLPPASYLICDAKGNIKIEKYWHLDYQKKMILPVKEYSGRVMDLLEEATKIRMVSDVPLGALLSGGIDSSAVVGLMAKHSTKPVKTFSIGFSESDYSELKYAKLVADHFKTEHHEFIVTPKVIEILPKLVWHYSEPYADSSMLPSYYVANETRKHVTVALNGDGGDENFAGYPRYLAQKLISQPMVRGLSKLIHHLILPSGNADPRKFFTRLKRFTKVAHLQPAQRYLQWQLCFDAVNRQKLYQPWLSDAVFSSLPCAIGKSASGGRDELKKYTGDATENYLLNLYNNAPARTSLDRMLYTDMMSYLPDDLLVKMDIASMANSLESRSPFLDHKLVGFASQIPPALKLKGFTLKYILKKALKGFVPDRILIRGKMGFGVPINRWFRNDLKGYIQKTLSPEAIRKRNYLQPEAVQHLMKEHFAGRVDNGARLWALLVLEIWFQTFIDR